MLSYSHIQCHGKQHTPVQLRKGRLDVLDEQQRLLLDHQVDICLWEEAHKGRLRRFCCLKFLSEQKARPA